MAAAPEGFFWGSCTVEDSWDVGRYRHLIRIGGVDTRCNASASGPDIWVPGHPKPQCTECLATLTPAPAARSRAHALTVEWNGEYGEESSSTGTCRCGNWEESASNQREVRFEYREHLKSVKRAATKTP